MRLWYHLRALRLTLIYPLLALLPRAWSYRGATFLGTLEARWNPDLRVAVGNGLNRGCLGSREDPRALEEWLRRYAQMQAREILDSFWLPRLGRSGLKAMVEVDGLAELRSAVSEGRGVILVMAHFSRLIMLLAALGAHGVRMNMLTMRIDEGNPDLLPAERRYLSRKVASLLDYIGGDWLPLGRSMRPIYQGLARGEVWIVLLDAHDPDGAQRRDYPFLNGRIRLAQGVERIAARTGAAMIYASVNERSATDLTGRLVRLPQTPDRAVAAAVRELESDVLSAPWQWWQWNILDYIWSPREEAVS